MNYIEVNESFISQQREMSEQEIAEMHADKTTYIDDDHPMWIAYQKSLKEKTYTTKELIEMIKNGTYDD
jgi:hypothetical protein